MSSNFSPNKLVRYSFIWSQARLIIAAAALFLGGKPPVTVLLGGSPTIWSLLQLCWIISGIASVYLLVRWFQGGQKVFGAKKQKDMITFFVSVISGLNLGLVGLLGTNIGMSISSNYTIFILAGIIYLLSALYLQQRWNSSGHSLV